MNEFELIERYFQQKPHRSDVMLEIGHDATLLKPPTNELIANTIDTLIENIHFFPETGPFDLGYKSLAVNLSDLSAIGAKPAWYFLALTMPKADPFWLEEFSRGLFNLAQTYDMDLVGGDTTRGPLVITIQAQGFIPPDLAHTRRGAKPGDLIYVTGSLGDAALGLSIAKKGGLDPLNDAQKFLLTRYHRPTPQVAAGIALRGIASSAIDISDGLAADLSHILTMSQVGATIYLKNLPLSQAFDQIATTQEKYPLALTGGDDYELCFTVPSQKESELKTAMASINCPYQQIGRIEKTPGLHILDENNQPITLTKTGYLHFNL